MARAPTIKCSQSLVFLSHILLQQKKKDQIIQILNNLETRRELICDWSNKIAYD